MVNNFTLTQKIEVINLCLLDCEMLLLNINNKLSETKDKKIKNEYLKIIEKYKNSISVLKKIREEISILESFKQIIKE